MNLKSLRTYIAVIGFVGIFASAVQAQAIDRESLRGLKGLAVKVSVDKDVNISEALLKTDVELKLRLAGIPVLERVADPQSSGPPYIRVDLHPCNVLEVEIVQEVSLRRNPGFKMFAPTWSYVSVLSKSGKSGEPAPLGIIREALANIVDESINDYLAVNPK